MRQQPLPVELQHFSHLPDLQFRGNGEWSSACPICGGANSARRGNSDRFRLFTADAKGNARVWCRQCGAFEWADKDTKLRPSPEAIQQAKEIRLQLVEAENQRLRARLDELQEKAYWRGYHDAMREGHRALWRQAGIPNEFQDYWQLGFHPAYKGNCTSGQFTSPALTIPYFSEGWQPVNIQYRLTSPPQPNDKYRFTYGLKPDLWLTEPDKPIGGKVILVEGMKKAAVTFIQLVAQAGEDFLIVAVPSKTPSTAMLDRLKDCECVFVALDPDAYTGKNPASKRVGEYLGNGVRFVRLPAKADDLFNDYEMTPRSFMSYINQATKSV